MMLPEGASRLMRDAFAWDLAIWRSRDGREKS